MLVQGFCVQCVKGVSTVQGITEYILEVIITILSLSAANCDWQVVTNPELVLEIWTNQTEACLQGVHI